MLRASRMAPAKLDLVIVGGGPAGISTALHVLEARPALASRMVVLEKARYPRDKYCAGAIGGRGLRLLERIGVRVDVPLVPIHAISIRVAGGVVVVREPDLGIVVRRIEFDEALAREAQRRGIELREGAAVERVESRLDGVKLTLASGETIDTRAVVAADGVAGVVRRSAGLGRVAWRAQVIEADTEAAPGDPARDTLHFDFDDPSLVGYGWAFPTRAGGRDLVCRGIYRIGRATRASGAEPQGRQDVRARFERHLAARGIDAARCRLKPFAEQGFDPGEPASAPRVLLVGEAAGIDIATGEGIAQALQYGQLAGRYLARAFAGRDLGFADWSAQVRAARLGWQLRQRFWFQSRFYGAERSVMERMILGMPSAMRLGALQFAGKAFDARALARAASEALRGSVRVGPARLARALRAG
jgi:menaquinone-9 beta-reductase